MNTYAEREDLTYGVNHDHSYAMPQIDIEALIAENQALRL